MRILRFLLTGTTLAIAGVLATLASDPASAAAPHARAKANPAAAPKARAEHCVGPYEAMENGVCVHTKFVNPDRVPEDFTVYYRSTSSKH
jgi:hypothetical protein